MKKNKKFHVIWHYETNLDTDKLSKFALCGKCFHPASLLGLKNEKGELQYLCTKCNTISVAKEK